MVRAGACAAPHPDAFDIAVAGINRLYRHLHGRLRTASCITSWTNRTSTAEGRRLCAAFSNYRSRLLGLILILFVDVWHAEGDADDPWLDHRGAYHRAAGFHHCFSGVVRTDWEKRNPRRRLGRNQRGGRARSRRFDLFTTTLLETGTLADKGLPTGRRITFMNGFAIRGQYFNFSTTGQWMWDEIDCESITDRGYPRDR